MRPLIYAYMRLTGSDEPESGDASAHRELADYAAREGFTLDQVFTEGIWQAESAFAALLNALRRHEVRDVLVPSLWHFSRLPGLQDAMRVHIERETGARLWIAQGARR